MNRITAAYTIGKYPNNEIMFLLALQVMNRYSYLPMVKTFLQFVAYRNIGYVCKKQPTKLGILSERYYFDFRTLYVRSFHP